MRGNKLYNALAEALAMTNAPVEVQVAIAKVLKSENPNFKSNYFYNYIDAAKQKYIQPREKASA